MGSLNFCQELSSVACFLHTFPISVKDASNHRVF